MRGAEDIIKGALGKMKPAPADAPDAADDVDIAEEAAGRAVMQAMKAGDAAAFTSALKSFLDICGYTGEPPAEEII